MEESIIGKIKDLKKRCRKDAEKNDFTRTDETIANFMKFAETDDEQLNEIYRKIANLLINYKAKVINTRQKLNQYAMEWVSGNIQEYSLVEVNNLLNDLYSV